MKTNQLLIGALILVGGYVVYTRFIKKSKDESNDAKNGKEIATPPQQTNPNVQQTCGGANVRCAPPKSSFMDFDGELEFEKDIY
jgi:hypothetical protein